MERSQDGACSTSVGIARPTRGLEAARAWRGCCVAAKNQLHVTLLAGMVREAGLALPGGPAGQGGGWAHSQGDPDPDAWPLPWSVCLPPRPFQDPRATTENPSGGVQRLRLLEVGAGLPPCLPLPDPRRKHQLLY